MTLEWFDVDPLPVPPAVPMHSTAYYRWLSRVTLQARAEAQ